MTKEVPLTQGQVAVVDDEDYERVIAAGPWRAQHINRAWRVRRWAGKHMLPLANFVLDVPIGTIVDHKDRNALNNTRSNLRTATHSENMHNRTKSRWTTSPYYGVSRASRPHKWQARITKKGQQYHLGTYDDPTVAARAYDKKARELYGDMARLNFPDDVSDQ
jgi:hypothetical protein